MSLSLARVRPRQRSAPVPEAVAVPAVPVPEAAPNRPPLYERTIILKDKNGDDYSATIAPPEDPQAPSDWDAFAPVPGETDTEATLRRMRKLYACRVDRKAPPDMIARAQALVTHWERVVRGEAKPGDPPPRSPPKLSPETQAKARAFGNALGRVVVVSLLAASIGLWRGLTYRQQETAFSQLAWYRAGAIPHVQIQLYREPWRY
jgi:hypothetical protein